MLVQTSDVLVVCLSAEISALVVFSCFLWLSVPSLLRKTKYLWGGTFSQRIFITKQSCESASAGVFALVRLTELCYVCFLYIFWEGSSAVHSLSSLVAVAIETILVQFFLHPCNLLGWHCCSTSTGDKILRFTEKDLSKNKCKITASSI